MAYRGSDGQWYNDANEAVGASNRYNQQREQNDLLARQNQLLQNQIREQNNNFLKQMKLEQEKLKEQRSIERSRQHHESEMRILSLCDEIGISRVIMDSFINYMFSGDSNADKILNNIDKLDNEKEALLADSEKNKKKSRQLEIIKQLKQLDKTNIGELDSNNELHPLLEKHKQDIKNITIWYALSFACMFIFPMALGSNSTFLLLLIGMIPGMIPLIITLFKLFNFVGLRKRIMSMCDKQIVKLEKEIKNEKDDKIQKIEDKLDEEWEKYNNALKKAIIQKTEDFYQFRINNYNAKIEKFLLDFELSEKLKEYNIDYKIVNKAIAQGNGNIEDYISYFMKYINQNQ